MKKGDRVIIIDGVLEGEKATIVPHPETKDKWEDGNDVFIRFDRHEAHLGKEHGYAILSPQWYEKSRLKVIS